MIVVKRVIGACLGCRVILGILLSLAAVVHLSRIATLSDGVERASSAGLGISYLILVCMVTLGERWAFVAAMVFPLIAQVLGDFHSFAHYSNPLDASDPIVDLLVIPAAAYVIRATGRKPIRN